MDQKLLDALSNMSSALEQIAAALKKGKDDGSDSATTAALKGGDFVKQIKEINIGVKQLQIDTKKILKNQETLLRLSKKGKKSEFENIGGDKKKESDLKKGIGTILLIAIAVLAIGIAFKLVGGINFLSVIGLSLALLILSYAFEKIAKLNISIKQAAVTSSSLVLMAAAVTFSSWILKKITPIGFTQALTMILIGVGFSMLSPAISSIIEAFGGMSWGGVIKASFGLVIVLPAIAKGIELSSHILKKVTPIGLMQAVSAILIAGIFTVISFGIKNLLEAFGGASIFKIGKAVLFLPIILPLISSAIVKSSAILNKTQPIGLMQALSAIMIAAVFSVVSFGLKNIIEATEKVKSPAKLFILPLLLPAVAKAIELSSKYLKKVQMMSFGQFIVALGISILFIVFAFTLKILNPILDKIKLEHVLTLPLLMTTLSIAIMLSSHILKKTAEIEYSKLLNLLVFSIVFAISAIVIAAVAWVIGKYFGVTNVLKGAVAIVALAATVMVSSLIISKGNYSKYPSLDWATGVGLSLAVFGVSAWLLGLSVFGPQALVFAAGLGAVTVVAAAIAASSHILAKGSYDKKYPTKKWSEGVAMALAAFTPIYTMLLDNAPGLFGSGSGVSPSDFAKAIVTVTRGIVTAAKEFADPKNKGIWKKAPTKEWAIGVALALQAFSPIYGMLMKNAIFKMLGSGGVGPNDFAKAIVTVTRGIVTAAQEFASDKNKGVWKKAPTKEWAAGVSIALEAFSPIYGMLMKNAIFKMLGSGGVGPNDFAKAIVTVTRGIITAAQEFASDKNKGVWKKAPTKEWAAGVSIALEAFSPIYGMLMKNAIFKRFGSGGVGPNEFSKAIVTVTRGIVSAAQEFGSDKNKGVWAKAPTKEWAEGVKLALEGFSPIYSMLLAQGILKKFKIGGVGPQEFSDAIVTVSKGIVAAGREFNSPDNAQAWKGGPTKAWAEGVGIAMEAFSPVYSMLLKQGIFKMLGVSGVGPKEFSDAIVTVSKGIITAAGVFAANTAPFKEGSYPTKAWGEGVGAALKAFAPVFKTLSDDTGWFTSGDEVINNMVHGILSITTAIIKVGYKLAKSGLDWNIWPKAEWGKGVSSSIMKFKSLGDKIGTDIPITTGVLSIVGVMVPVAKTISENSAYFEKAVISPTFADKLSHNIVKFSKIMNYVNNKLGGSPSVFPILAVASTIVRVAKRFSSYHRGWFYAVRDVKEVDEWAYQLKWATRKFVNLLNWTNKHASGVSNFFMIEKVATHITKVAEIIAKGHRAFNTKVNPGFMQSLYKNFIYYIEMVKRLKKEQGGIGSAISRAITGDPVINMAKGMLTLAHAYDRLASSLTKMGKAMALFNDKKISQLERITKIRPHYGNPAGLAALGGAISNSISNALSVSSSMPAVQTSAKTNQEKKGDIFPKGRYGNIAKQQDMIIDLLQLLNDKLNIGSNIDSATIKYLNEKKSAKM